VRDQLYADPRYLDRRGRPKPLPVFRRDGGEHSFEALVESVSRDLHPRSVLEQWLQTRIAHLDEQGRVVLDDFGTRDPAHPDLGAVSLRLMLYPVVQVLSQYLLRELRGGGWFASDVGGLSPEAAIELAAQAREEMRRLIVKQNLRAEQRARRDQRRKAGGSCVLMVGGFQYVAGLPPLRATPPEPTLPVRRSRRATRPGHAPRSRP
jgi:hypothetical protein